jgi:hypothetical protein
VLLSKGKIFSAMAGLAILALPVSAFAGHRQDNRFAGRPAERPFIAHDRGIHNGWSRPTPPIQFARPIYRQSVRQFMPPPRPIGWNNEWREEAGERAWQGGGSPNYWAQRRFPGSAYGCDADGDECGRPNYRWRSDYRQQYQPSYEDNENYGGQPYSWYTQSAPAGYNQMQRRDWLISRRQNAMSVIAQMRARGDSRGAARMVRAVNSLTAQINAIDRQSGYGYNGGRYNGYGYNGGGYNGYGYGGGGYNGGGYNYAPSSYGPSNYAAPGNPLLGALTGNSGYYGTPNSNPALNAVGSLIGPMLGIQ